MKTPPKVTDSIKDATEKLEASKRALRDMKFVKKAKLSDMHQQAAGVMVMSLHELRRIAKEQGVSMDDISAEHIISDLTKLDAEVQKLTQLYGSIRKTK
jgi:hypothetical protein